MMFLKCRACGFGSADQYTLDPAQTPGCRPSVDSQCQALRTGCRELRLAGSFNAMLLRALKWPIAQMFLMRKPFGIFGESAPAIILEHFGDSAATPEV